MKKHLGGKYQSSEMKSPYFFGDPFPLCSLLDQPGETRNYFIFGAVRSEFPLNVLNVVM